MTTLKEALGPAALPLSAVVANWRLGGRLRRFAVRLAHPNLSRALDDLAEGLENVIGPL